MSKMRLRTRKAANRWHAPQLNKCSQCGSSTRAHIACPSCGYYRGRQVLTIEAL
jgi:large subunit ribosomal protein L32